MLFVPKNGINQGCIYLPLLIIRLLKNRNEFGTYAGKYATPRDTIKKDIKIKLMKKSKKELSLRDIKKQFNELESVASEFAQKIENLKQQQDDFVKYMKVKDLFH